MKKGHFRHRSISVTVLFIVFTLLVAGCGADKKSSNDAAGIEFSKSKAENGNVADSPPISELPAWNLDGSTGYGVLDDQIVRKIIRNANIEQKVTDLDEAIEQVMKLIADSRGYLQSSSIREYSERERVADYVLRIPEGSYATILMQLRQIGKNVNIRESGSDVTEEYYDNEARIKNLKLQEEAVQKLFERADKMEDILAIQKELFSIRGDIESLQGRNRYLDNVTSLSTIELTIREVKPVEYLKEENESAFSRAKEGFIDTLGALSRYVIELFVFMISALPVLMIAIVVAIVLWILLRKRRSKSRFHNDSNESTE